MKHELFKAKRKKYHQLFLNNSFAQNKNNNQNWPFLAKDMNYLSFHSLTLSG